MRGDVYASVLLTLPKLHCSPKLLQLVCGQSVPPSASAPAILPGVMKACSGLVRANSKCQEDGARLLTDSQPPAVSRDISN